LPIVGPPWTSWEYLSIGTISKHPFSHLNILLTNGALPNMIVKHLFLITTVDQINSIPEGSLGTDSKPYAISDICINK
jgi:hypothetical protein